jgi:uroporphyrinogen decarboxylase
LSSESRKQRWERLEKTIRHEKTDRPPVVIMGSIPCAKLADPEVVVADAIERPEWFLDKAFEGLDILEDVDAIQGFSSALSRTKGLNFMCRVKLPGEELGRDDMIQILEEPRMTYDDYDYINTKGWKAFQEHYQRDILGITPSDFELSKRFRDYANQKLANSEYVEWGGGGSPAAWDMLTSMRGMTRFFRDLKKDPALIKETLATIHAECFPEFKAGLTKGDALTVMVQPGVRCNCDFVNREIFEEFTWPYVVQYADAVLEAGRYVHFHYDACWDDFLDFFTYFPKNCCIFDTDGATDIHKVGKILGGRMAITGNITASMLSLGTPEEVYATVKSQIDEFGDGYIICSACTIPSNCKPENLKAMVSACK